MNTKFISTSALALGLMLSPIVALPVLAHETKMEMMQSSPNAAEAPYDIQFIDTMAEHHRQGIKMFKVGAEKAQSQELRDKSQKMVDDQEKEISELKTMQEKIKPNAPEAINMKMPGMMAMDMGQMAAASNKDFDHNFLNMTIKHHQCAVDMSRDALKHAKSEQVKDRAQIIIDMQTKEIADMQRMHDAIK